jgi:Bacterial lectin/Beta-propeller repeat
MNIRPLVLVSLLSIGQPLFAQSVISGHSAAPRDSPVSQFALAKAALNPASPGLVKNYGNIPLSFEANQGQNDPQVKFSSHGNGYSLYLTDTAAVIALSKGEPTRKGIERKEIPGKPALASETKRTTDIVRMELIGANVGIRVEGVDRLPGTANYFVGNSPSKWHSNLPTYGKVKYAGVYPGVDLVYYGNQHLLEYDFVVSPHADPNDIRLHFAGARKLRLNFDGDLTISAKNGEVAFHKPIIYQVDNGQRRAVSGRFIIMPRGLVRFALGSYDPTLELVVDPVLAYSTYLSGAAVTSIAVDAFGSAYVTGFTTGDLPVTSGSFQRFDHSPQSYTAFVTKLNPAGTALVYSTYLGGSGNLPQLAGDRGNAIAVDPFGDAYVTGWTYSPDFPVSAGAFQPQLDSENGGAFVTKINSSGTALVYSTYLNGSGNAYEGVGDMPNAIFVDPNGDAYVTGVAYSRDFPVTLHAFQPTNHALKNCNCYNAFVSELNSDGTGLVYSTYLGGSGSPSDGDFGSAIAADSDGNAYVAGETGSSDFPVSTHAFQKVSYGDYNVFITKVNPGGTGLVYSTYLSGSNGVTGSPLAIAVNSDRSAYVAGNTSATDFPVTSGAFQGKNFAGNDCNSAFVTKMAPSGSSLVYSTYLGGTSSNCNGGVTARGLAIDLAGNAYVDGTAFTGSFPVTSNAYQKTNKSQSGSAFLSEVDPQGMNLLYSTYLGGSGASGAQGLALDAVANPYITGAASSADFPVTDGAFETTFEGPNDSFVAKFALHPTVTSPPVIDFSNGFSDVNGSMQFNGSTTIDGSQLLLTTGVQNQAGSAFYATQINVQRFTTDFTFLLSDAVADGFTFTIQNVGLGVLGGSGGRLGYAGIGKSIAIKFDLYNNRGEGPDSTGLYIDGALPNTPAINLSHTGIDLHSGDPMAVHIAYNIDYSGGELILTITDQVTNAVWSNSFAVDIPATVGSNSAYVGFTGATGDGTSTQAITSWTYEVGP